MPTTVDGLPNQTTIEPGDLFVLQNTAANRTRNITYDDLLSELTNDMDVITTAQLASAIAGVTAAFQAADLANLQKVFIVGSRISLIGGSALTNPGIALGFGTWVKEEAKYYAGYKSGDATFGTVGDIIGSTTHNHSGVVGGTTLNATQIPEHNHTLIFSLYNEVGVGSGRVASGGIHNPEDTFVGNTSYVGGSQPHNHTIPSSSNFPPTIVEVVWRRTA